MEHNYIWNEKFVAMDTDVGGGFPVASHLSMMSSEEKAMMDSGWAVISGGIFTRDRETTCDSKTTREKQFIKPIPISSK